MDAGVVACSILAPMRYHNQLTLPTAMHSFQNTIIPPVPTPSDTVIAWDEAFLRVESYLRAHHIESRVLLNELATDIIREAKIQVFTRPGEEPVAAALQVTHARIDAWFARVGNPGDWSNERVREDGRLALVLANQPGRWVNCFLSAEPVPPGLAAALGAVVFQPGPDLNFCNMSAEPLEFGFDDQSGSQSFRNSGWLSIRAAASWLLILGIYGSAWAASH
jgi:hypothetical protein